MAIFVSLVNWTEQGIAGFKDTSKRVDAVQETLAKAASRPCTGRSGRTTSLR
ncbi:MAG: hypothetical protein ACRDHO_10995 [Actinomycetota bacterium]